MRNFGAYETGASHDDHLAARGQRWWHDGSATDADGELASRGHLQCGCEAC